jgi:hypothetical protein
MIDLGLFVGLVVMLFFSFLMTPLVSTIIRFIIMDNHLEFIVQHIILFSIILVILTIDSIFE